MPIKFNHQNSILNFSAGTNSTPAIGDLWSNSGAPTWYNGATKTLAYTDSNITGTSTNVSGIVTYDHGGTGFSSYVIGDIIYASATNTLNKLAKPAATSFLSMTSAGVPSWQPSGNLAYNNIDNSWSVDQTFLNDIIISANNGLSIGGGAPAYSLHIKSFYNAGKIGIYLDPAALTNNADPFGARLDPTISSASTTSYVGFRSAPSTQAATFTIGTVTHFHALFNTKGAGSTITNQYGFFAASTLGTTATNSYGFYSDLAASASSWNIYSVGTAKNYFNGTVLIGSSTDDGTNKLQVTGASLFTGATTATGIVKSNTAIQCPAIGLGDPLGTQTTHSSSALLYAVDSFDLSATRYGQYWSLNYTNTDLTANRTQYGHYQLIELEEDGVLQYSTTISNASWSGGIATYTSTSHGFQLPSGTTISTITWSASVVTVTTTAAHGMTSSIPHSVVIAGCTPTGYNGTYSCTVTGATTFTYALTANPGVSSVVGTATETINAAITGVNPNGYNQFATITVVDANTFTAPLTVNPGVYVATGQGKVQKDHTFTETLYGKRNIIQPKTISVTNCTSTASSNIITTTGDFISSGVIAGMTLTGTAMGGSSQYGMTVLSVDSTTQITVSANVVTPGTSTLTFYLGYVADTVIGSENVIQNFVGMSGKNAIATATATQNRIINYRYSAPNTYITSARGAYNEVYNDNATGYITTAYGSQNQAYNAYTGYITSAYGSYNAAYNSSTGNIGTATGTYTTAYNTSTGTITTALYGIDSEVYANSTATIPLAVGTYNYVRAQGASATSAVISDARGTYNYVRSGVSSGSTPTITIGYGVHNILERTYGTFTTAIGLYNVFTGTITNKWGVYSSGESGNFLTGGLQIGGTAPTISSIYAGKLLHVYGDAEVTGTITLNNVVTTSTTTTHPNHITKSLTATTTSTTQIVADTFAAASYQSAEYIIKSNDGSHIFLTKLLVTYSPSTNNVFITQYGSIYTNSSTGLSYPVEPSDTTMIGVFTVTADYSAPNVRLLITPANATSTTFKIQGTIL